LHSIIAGTFGAILLPTFMGLWWTGRSKAFAAVGIVSGIIMAITAVASTPLIGLAAGTAAVCFWPMRRYARHVRWGTVVVLLGLQLVMKAPVWALITRVELTGGSSKWHRFLLIDNFIHRFGEWWLLGTRDNAGWGYDMWDASNWYVASGVGGGLLVLALFVGLIGAAFSCVGKCLQKRNARDPAGAKFAWGLGAAVFSGSVAFMGIKLFDQSVVMWYALLAIIAAVAAVTTEPVLRSTVQVKEEEAAVSPAAWNAAKTYRV
jgi:hypothetical protein